MAVGLVVDNCWVCQCGSGLKAALLRSGPMEGRVPQVPLPMLRARTSERLNIDQGLAELVPPIRIPHPASFSLSWRGGGSTFCVMHQSAFSWLRHRRHLPGANCERHQITFPSNRAVGAAAQSNSTVSIAPPRHPSTINSALFRRPDGYSAKS
jgi:hypothetical protein